MLGVEMAGRQSVQNETYFNSEKWKSTCVAHEQILEENGVGSHQS